MGKEVLIGRGGQAVIKLTGWMLLQDAKGKQNVRELQLHKMKSALIGRLVGTSEKPWLGNY